MTTKKVQCKNVRKSRKSTSVKKRTSKRTATKRKVTKQKVTKPDVTKPKVTKPKTTKRKSVCKLFTRKSSKKESVTIDKALEKLCKSSVEDFLPKNPREKSYTDEFGLFSSRPKQYLEPVFGPSLRPADYKTQNTPWANQFANQAAVLKKYSPAQYRYSKDFNGSSNAAAGKKYIGRPVDYEPFYSPPPAPPANILPIPYALPPVSSQQYGYRPIPYAPPSSKPKELAKIFAKVVA